MTTSSDALQFFVRHEKGLTVYLFDKQNPSIASDLSDVLHACWSSDGTYLVVNTSASGLRLFANKPDTFSLEEVAHLDRPSSASAARPALRHLHWSPQGTFLTAFYTYASPTPASTTAVDDRNVWVWQVPSDKNENSKTIYPSAGFVFRGLRAGQWPILRWRTDEAACVLLQRNQISVLNGRTFELLAKLPIAPNALALSAEPAPGSDSQSLIVACVSQNSGKASAALKIFEIPLIPAVGPRSVNGPLLRFTLGNLDTVDLAWSCSGQGCLVTTTSDVDTAGQNYGDVCNVFLVSNTNGMFQCRKVNTAVAQQARWNPSRPEFVLIEGRSPSEMALFDESGDRLFSFPPAYRNTVKWDASGEMIALGGFGNLAGDLNFWYRDPESKEPVLICDWRENCTVTCGWSLPDGKYFFTASTFPRMRVDNSLKIYNRESELLYSQKFDRLYDFQWRPTKQSTLDGWNRVPKVQPSALEAMPKFKTATEAVANRKLTEGGGSSDNNSGPKKPVRYERSIGKEQLEVLASEWRTPRPHSPMPPSTLSSPYSDPSSHSQPTPSPPAIAVAPPPKQSTITSEQQRKKPAVPTPESNLVSSFGAVQIPSPYFAKDSNLVPSNFFTEPFFANDSTPSESDQEQSLFCRVMRDNQVTPQPRANPPVVVNPPNPVAGHSGGVVDPKVQNLLALFQQVLPPDAAVHVNLPNSESRRSSFAGEAPPTFHPSNHHQNVRSNSVLVDSPLPLWSKAPPPIPVPMMAPQPNHLTAALHQMQLHPSSTPHMNPFLPATNLNGEEAFDFIWSPDGDR